MSVASEIPSSGGGAGSKSCQPGGPCFATVLRLYLRVSALLCLRMQHSPFPPEHLFIMFIRASGYYRGHFKDNRVTMLSDVWPVHARSEQVAGV